MGAPTTGGGRFNSSETGDPVRIFRRLLLLRVSVIGVEIRDSRLRTATGAIGRATVRPTGRDSRREQTCHKQGVQPQVLTLHSDRGAPMTSKCTAQLLADLGVTRSLSRPQVSDDNPFSEAQFKTLKYHPGFPGRFHDLTAAIAFCRSFFPWYNTEHRHAGIAMLTPEDVHHHRAHSVLEQRERTLQAAWTRHPERFVRGVPQPDPLPQAVWINPPAITTTGETAQ